MTMMKLACAAFLGLSSAVGVLRAQDAVQPTSQHRELAKAVGTWDGELKIWMQGPGAPPTVSKGVERISLMPGGLWLISETEGELNGKPFHGRGLSGYDPIKKKYVDVWIDSNNPHLTSLEGEYDEAKKTITNYGKSTDPRSGSEYDIKTETVLDGEDERKFTFYIKTDQTGGEYLKILEMSYKRRSE